MRYELWYSESRRQGALLDEKDAAKPKPSDAQLIWAVEANTYDEARQKRDEFLERAEVSFAPYSDPDAVQELHELIDRGANEPGLHRSDRSASSEETTRVTTVVFRDGHGNEQSFEVPGWIGITSKLADHAGEIAAHLSDSEEKTGPLATTLEQIFVERPYRDLSTAPAELTVVVLRSADGSGMGMLQEFAGRIDDQTLLATLVSRRLGPGIADWRFAEVRAFKRPGR
jgi:hypothetical protein